MKKFKRLVLGLFTFLFAFSSASCNLTGMLGGISLSGTESEANSDITSDVTSEPMGSVTIESNTPSEDTPSTNTYIDKLYSSYDELLEFYNKALRDSADDEKRLERLENLETQIESILYQINMYAENGKLSYSEYRSLLKSINSLEEDIDYILNSSYVEPERAYLVTLYNENGYIESQGYYTEGTEYYLPGQDYMDVTVYWYDMDYGTYYLGGDSIYIDRDYNLQRELRGGFGEENYTVVEIDTDGDGWFDNNFEVAHGETVYASPNDYYEYQDFDYWSVTIYDEYGNVYYENYNGWDLYYSVWGKNIQIKAIYKSISESETCYIDVDVNGDGIFDQSFLIIKGEPIIVSAEDIYDNLDFAYWEATEYDENGNVFTNILSYDYELKYTTYSNRMELKAIFKEVEITENIVSVYTGGSVLTSDQIGEYTIATNLFGTIIYASYGLTMGYGGPADGFYHNGDYECIAGETCGIFKLDPEFAGWPAVTPDGVNAWALYEIVVPKGGYIITGSADEMRDIIYSITGHYVDDYAGNYLFESALEDGMLCDRHVTVTESEGYVLVDGNYISKCEVISHNVGPIVPDSAFVDTYTWVKESGILAEDGSSLVIDCGNYTITIYQDTSSTPCKNIYEQLRIYQEAIFEVKVKPGFKLYGFYFEEVMGKAESIDLSVDNNVNLLSYSINENLWDIRSEVPLNSISFKLSKQMRWTELNVILTKDDSYETPLGNVEVDYDGDGIVDSISSYLYGEILELSPSSEIEFLYWEITEFDENGVGYPYIYSYDYILNYMVCEPRVLLKAVKKSSIDVPVDAEFLFGGFINAVNTDAGGDALAVIESGNAIHTDGQWSNTSYGGNANWRLIIVVDAEGKIAYLVKNPANGYGGPNGTGYYAHPDYADDYTTNPAFNILEGYGPWTPEDSQSSTKFEIVVPEGGFIIVSHGTASENLLWNLSEWNLPNLDDYNVNTRDAFKSNMRIYRENDNSMIKIYKIKEVEINPDIPDSINGITIYSEGSTNIVPNEYTFGIDKSGKVIYATYGLEMGYGGPADGFYHDGSYSWTPGKICGIFDLDPEFDRWPNITPDGVNAWTLYEIVVPKGGYILTGNLDAVHDFVLQLTGLSLYDYNYNSLFESYLVDGELNGKKVEVSSEGIFVNGELSPERKKMIFEISTSNGYSQWVEFDWLTNEYFSLQTGELSAWQNVTVCYIETNENGEQVRIPLNYDNISLTGYVTSYDYYGCDWTNNLYHETDANGVDCAKIGKFYTSTGGNYRFVLNPYKRTLFVNYDKEKTEGNYFEVNGVKVYDSNYVSSLEDYTVAIDASGKVIYASYTASGYGGPADSFYDDGSFVLQNGQICGIFEIGEYYGYWPNYTIFGEPAWTQFDIKVPEGGYILTGDESEMNAFIYMLTNRKLSLNPQGSLFESLYKGELNNKYVTVDRGGIYIDGQLVLDSNVESYYFEISHNGNIVSFEYELNSSEPIYYELLGVTLGEMIRVQTYNSYTNERRAVDHWNSIILGDVNPSDIMYENPDCPNNLGHDGNGVYYPYNEDGYSFKFYPDTKTLEVTALQTPDYGTYSEIAGIKVYSSDYIRTLDDFTVAVDANGTIIYAGRTSSGYGGPADGFYHDGSYSWTAGEICGIFDLDPEFDRWPNKTSDGRNAWNLYSVKVPEGGYIFTGSYENMYPLLSQIDPNVSEPNNYFEWIEDGLFNLYKIYFYGTSYEVVNSTEKSIVGLTWEGTTSGSLNYNEATGLYEGVTTLWGSNEILFYYFYSDGTTELVYYDNTNLEGSFTPYDLYGTDFSDALYHEEEYGKFYSNSGGLYSFTYNEYTNTLVASYLARYEDVYQTLNPTYVNNLEDYRYVGSLEYSGQSLLMLKLSSSSEYQSLNSIRIEFDKVITCWFKDGVVINQNGEAISSATQITQEGVYVIVDIKKTAGELSNGFIHIHAGGYGDSSGDLTVEGWLIYR